MLDVLKNSSHQKWIAYAQSIGNSSAQFHENKETLWEEFAENIEKTEVVVVLKQIGGEQFAAAKYNFRRDYFDSAFELFCNDLILQEEQEKLIEAKKKLQEAEAKSKEAQENNRLMQKRAEEAEALAKVNHEKRLDAEKARDEAVKSADEAKKRAEEVVNANNNVRKAYDKVSNHTTTIKQMVCQKKEGSCTML